MKQQNRSFAILISFFILAIGAVPACARYRVADNVEAVAIGVGAVVLALIVSATIQVADQWDQAVILRLGKFRALKVAWELVQTFLAARFKEVERFRRRPAKVADLENRL